MNKLSGALDTWEALGVDDAGAGEKLVVTDTTKELALTQVVPDTIKQMFLTSPNTEDYAAIFSYVKGVRNHRCNSLGTEAYKRLSDINDVNQVDEEESTGETTWYTDNYGIMYVVTPKGKGKGKKG